MTYDNIQIGNRYYQSYLKANTAQDKKLNGYKAIRYWMAGGKTLTEARKGLRWSEGLYNTVAAEIEGAK